MKKNNLIWIVTLMTILSVSLVSAGWFINEDYVSNDKITLPDSGLLMSGEFYNNGLTFISYSSGTTNLLFNYDLTVPYDITTGVLSSKGNCGAQYGISGGHFSDDGLTLYFTQGYTSTLRLYECCMTIPYNISSGVLSAQKGYDSGAWIYTKFVNDGYTMYVGNSATLYEYTFSTAYGGFGLNDMSSLVTDSTTFPEVPTTIRGYSLNDDGTELFVNTYDYVYEYNITTPYDLSTKVLVGNTSSPVPVLFEKGILKTTNYFYISNSAFDIYMYNSTTPVYEVPINNYPVIDLYYVNSSFYQNESISITGAVTDENLTSLTINSDSFYNNGNINAFQFLNNETLTVGSHDFIINATDNISQSTIVNLNVNILNFPNTPPVIETSFINDTTLSTISITGTVSDDYTLTSTEINDIRFTNIGTLTNFNFINNTYLDDGYYSVTITATDNFTITDEKIFTFVIENYVPSVIESPILTSSNISWINESHFNSGTYLNTKFGSVQLNDTLSGSYCSAIEDTNIINNRYSSIEFDLVDGITLAEIGLNYNDILGWYHLDDTGTSIVDSSSYNNNGVYSTTINSQDGIFNKSVDFYNSKSTHTLVSLGTEYTISVWAKVDALYGSTIDYHTIVGGNVGNYALMLNPSNNRFMMRDGVTTSFINFNMSTNWNHYVISRNNNLLTSYVNGQFLSNTTLANNNINYFNNIGGNSYSNLNKFFNGKIDELIIYNQTISNNEARILYETTIPSYFEYADVNRTLDLSIRSCDDTLCDSETFEDIDEVSPVTLNLSDNQYIQWCVNMTTTNVLYSPSIDNVIINFGENFAPTIPTNITFEPYPAYDNNELTATGSGSFDNDALTYYYKFETNTSELIQDYSIDNTLNLDLYGNVTLIVSTKAYDGVLYSPVFSKLIYIHEYTPPDRYINESEAVKIGVCPTTERGYKNLWLIIIIALVIGGFGIFIKNIYFVVIMGLMTMILSLSLMACGEIMGYILMLIGFGFLMTGMTIKTLL